MRDAQEACDPAAFTWKCASTANCARRWISRRLVRSAPQLLADVGEFMTLRAGDVLMLGCDAGRPLARPATRIEISAPGFETLANTLVGEAP